MILLEREREGERERERERERGIIIKKNKKLILLSYTVLVRFGLAL